MKKRTKICIIKKNIVPLRRLYQTVRNLQRFRTLNQLISVLFFYHIGLRRILSIELSATYAVINFACVVLSLPKNNCITTT